MAVWVGRNQMVNKHKNEEIRLWYLSRAYAQLREAQYYFDVFKYPESVECSYESIEFSLKTLCKIFGLGFPREHFLDKKKLVVLAEKIRGEGGNHYDELLGMLPIILGYTKEQRNICRYGIDENDIRKISPNKIFKKDYGEAVLDDATQLCDLLHHFDMLSRWSKNQPVKLGILNGHVEGSSDENRCTEYSGMNNDFWMDFFSSEKTVDESEKYAVSEINAKDINNEYSVILNPFGETYPEYSLKDKSVYKTIKSYIENGGVFVNTAGFPFFYAWDVKKKTENKQPISEEKVIMPTTFEIREGGTISATNLKELLKFTGTLFYREFDAVTTYDVKSHAGPMPEDIRQTPEDKSKFGDLLGEIKKISEYRALRGNAARYIPIIRASCTQFDEVYPIAALSHGKGYLIVGGMGMTTEDEVQLFAKAIDGFCDYMLSRHSKS